MEKRDNYALAAAQARALFLGRDHGALFRKLGLPENPEYLPARMLGCDYRISLTTGDITRREGENWVAANSFAESLTLLDLVCDSSPHRFATGRWKNMLAFGAHVHRGLLEGTRDETAEYFAAHMARFCAACEALGGTKLPQGDAAYAIPVFEDLNLGIQLWLGDEEFPDAIKIMWDENALLYLKYETMYYAKGLLLERLKRMMK